MNKLLKKLTAVLLLIMLMSANLSTTIYALSEEQLSEQNSKTQNSNVEFNAYFENETHTKTEQINNNAKLYANIKVENAGYLENAVISFENVNFKIDEKLQNEHVQSVDTKENKIILNKINNGSNVTIEIPISILDSEQVETDNFEKETISKFTATYVDSNGKEKEISKQVTNKLLWTGNAESTLETEVTKYIPYSMSEKSGVMLQVKVKSGIQNGKLPIKNTEINVQVPEINGKKPTYVNVIANKTKATNGESNGLNFNSQNYNYDETNGILTINTSNNQNEISWLKNVQDEYLINMIFDNKEIYDYVQTNNLNTKSSIESKINVYGNNNTITKNDTIQINETELKGNITDFNILSVEYINKGQVYANYVAEDKKEIPYAVRYTAQINSVDLTQTIKFVQQIDNFLTSSEQKNATTVAGNNYTYNKNVIINEKIFNKILGENGNIEIYNNINNEKIGTINTQTQLVDGNYVLDISNANTNQITVITSKPVLEGKLEIDIEKAIKGEIDYSKDQFTNFKKLLAETEAITNNETETKNIKVNLKEPVSSAEIYINKTKINTDTKNNQIEIRAVLNTLNSTSALYKNPTIQIELPSQIKNVNINNVKLLLEDELKIKNYSVKTENGKKIIVIELQGEQTKYFSADNIEQTNIIAKGANIIINANIELEELLTSVDTNIKMYYTNENSNLFEETEQSNQKLRTASANTITQGVTYAGVSLVAPQELTTINEISNYASTDSNTSNSEDEIEEAILYTSSSKKEATVKGKIANNLGNSIENVFILGKIPSTDSKEFDSETSFENTFNVLMKNAITVTTNNTYKIYYSTNANATKDLLNTENNWQENVTDFSSVKSYLIAISGEIAQQAEIEFTYNIEIPANLTYGNNSYLGYKVYFDSKTETATIGTTKTSGLINLTTGEKTELQVELTTNMDKKTIEHSENYYINNNLTSRFWLNVKNTSNMEAKNIKVKVNLPDDVKLVSYDETTGEFNELSNPITINSIKTGETEQIDFELQAECDHDNLNKLKTINVEVTAENTNQPANSNEINFAIIDSKFEKLTNRVNTLESITYSNSVQVNYEVTVKSRGELNNVKVHIPLPQSAEIQNAYWGTFEKNEAKVTRTETEAIIELSKIDGEQVLIFNFNLKSETDAKFSTKIYVEADDVEKCYSNERYITMKKANIAGEQLKPDKVYVKEQEEFEYKFTLNTTGGTQYNVVFEDKLPNEVKFSTAQVTIENTDDAEYISKQTIKYDEKNNVVKVIFPYLAGNSNVSIVLKVVATLEVGQTEPKEIINSATVQSDQTSTVQLNSVTNYIEYVASTHINPNTGEQEKPGNSSGNNNSNGSGNSNGTGTSNNTYKITGTAWLDANKNGERDSDEQLLSDIKVMLIYKNNSSIVKNSTTGESKIVTTGKNGTYEFTNIKKGEYLVVFLYDSGKYSITEYQKANVGESYNSDAQNMQITFEGKKTYAGVTDVIKITETNVRDIDIGLYEEDKFDLKLDKYISKITLTTPTIGTKVYEYTNSQLEKIEVLKQNIGKSSIVVEYKIAVTNEGQVSGYAKKIADYLPSEAKFNTEINQNWYKSENNNTVFNASLAETEIKPGETKEVTLILSYNITDKNIGTIINNNAEIYETYNKQGLSDIDSNEANMLEQEDDISKADIILSVATGRIMLNIGIILAVIAILVIGIYQIRKRVLKN